MKIKFKIVLSILIIMSILLGCNNKNNHDEKESLVETNNKDEIIELNIWSYYGGMEDIIKTFEDKYPNIKVNLKNFSYEEYVNEYKKSLLLNEGQADILIIDSNEYGEFNSIKGLEDLLDDRYNVKSYQKEFDEDLWNLGLALNKEELLGIPISSAPIVTYYREDILGKYGFPTEPKELAEFMKDSENWLNIARKLKEEDIYIFQWYSEIVKVASSGMPYFDSELKYLRDNEEFKGAIDIAIKANSENLALLKDIWSPSGKEALQQGKLAMVYLGSWGTNELKTLAPNLSGKWRVTELPFGVYGWNNSTLLSIPKNSPNKDAAWKFIEHHVFQYNDKGRIGNVSGYLPFREKEKYKGIGNEYLGGQKEQLVYEEVMDKVREYPVTPLDKKAFEIWDLAIRHGGDKDLSSEEIMNNIRESIREQLSKEIEILRNFKG